MDEKWEVRPSDLADLVNRVAHGESVDLTREGKTVARIVPVETTTFSPPSWKERTELRRQESLSKDVNARAAMENLLSLKVNLSLAPGETIKDLISEGRKY